MVLAVIPARFASQRFPGKPLASLGGRSVISHVYERVSSCALIDRVIVATDDDRILAHVRDFGGEATLTSPHHVSGTDRVLEVALGLAAGRKENPERVRAVVNIQGDEPFIRPEQIAAVVEPLLDSDGPDITTLAHPITDERALLSPNVVKVVRAESGRALYFSRHAIPYLRHRSVGTWIDEKIHLQHLGIYGFRASVLTTVQALPPSALETAESLEQLRWLEAGLSIHVGITPYPAVGIDTPEDLSAAERML